MADAEASISRRRTLSRIWIVPIVAVLLGIWMVYYTWSNEGPTITISFSTAEGLEAGKTKVKARSVAIGLVESVKLGKDLESVVVKAKLDLAARPLLREDTQLWVGRARIGAGGVSGLGTILSGGYIELAPGVGEPGRREYVGLEDPPLTPAGTPGLHLELVSSQAGSVSTGDAIFYSGYEVGRIESTKFDVEAKKLRYRAFIESPYDQLVNTRTRFWNASGISFNATAEGIELHTGSFQSMILGGVAFGLPTGIKPGSPVENGATFVLFAKRDDIDEQPYKHGVEYVVEFSRSVRGLQVGAPVEYRGVRSGVVVRVLLKELAKVIEDRGTRGKGNPIPVLIRLEPGRLQMGDTPEGAATLKEAVRIGVDNGMRATLTTGSLLTGSLYIALDAHPDEEKAEIGSFARWPTIPTIGGGLEAIEQRVAKLLDKLNALPLDDVTVSANATLVELQGTIAELRLLLESEAFQALPQSVDTSLAELNRTVRSVNALVQTLESQPNSLIFSREHAKDPEPPAGSP